MIDNGYGRIVNIGSTGGLGGYALRAPYSLSKSALIAFSKTLNQEIISGEYGESLNIKCFCVCPGPISGERFDKQVKDRAEYKNISNSVMKEKFTAILGRVLSSEEVVSKILETINPDSGEDEVILFGLK
jgi:ketoreductase